MLILTTQARALPHAYPSLLYRDSAADRRSAFELIGMSGTGPFETSWRDCRVSVYRHKAGLQSVTAAFSEIWSANEGAADMR